MNALLLIATIYLASFGDAAYSNVKMLCLVNKERANEGLPPMGLNE
jgi:hypothetical protein